MFSSIKRNPLVSERNHFDSRYSSLYYNDSRQVNNELKLFDAMNRVGRNQLSTLQLGLARHKEAMKAS